MRYLSLPSCIFSFSACCRSPNILKHRQIMRTINRIRTKDPDIYDSKKEWFVEQDEGGPSGESRRNWYALGKSEGKKRRPDVPVK